MAVKASCLSRLRASWPFVIVCYVGHRFKVYAKGVRHRSREGGDKRVLIDVGSLTNHYDAGNLNVATDLGATSPRHATPPGLANRAKNLGRGYLGPIAPASRRGRHDVANHGE